MGFYEDPREKLGRADGSTCLVRAGTRGSRWEDPHEKEGTSVLSIQVGNYEVEAYEGCPLFSGPSGLATGHEIQKRKR